MYPFFFFFFNYTLCAIQHRQKQTAHKRWPRFSFRVILHLFICLFEGIHCPKAFKWSSDQTQHPCVSLTIKKPHTSKIKLGKNDCAHVYTERPGLLRGGGKIYTNTDSLPKLEYKSAEVHIFPVKYFSASNTASKQNLILKKQQQKPHY